MLKILSAQIADSIDIKSLKAAYTYKLIHSDSDELFYQVGADQYIYVFRYGVVAFSNHEASDIRAFISFVTPYSKNAFDYELTEEFSVETNASENKFGYNKIELIRTSSEALRIIMLNVSQSVALDYYSNQTELLITELNTHTLFLEKKGKLDISGGKLKRFIGKTINLRNRINENLYIFDSAPETWEDEDLYKIDIELKKTFDLQSRYRNIQEELEIIKENLSLLIDLMHQRKSSMLELIVILLILFEVVNVLIEKIFL
jgi:required for meiotic nuclear division protein 1